MGLIEAERGVGCVWGVWGAKQGVKGVKGGVQRLALTGVS